MTKRYRVNFAWRINAMPHLEMTATYRVEATDEMDAVHRAQNTARIELQSIGAPHLTIRRITVTAARVVEP